MRLQQWHSSPLGFGTLLCLWSLHAFVLVSAVYLNLRLQIAQRFFCCFLVFRYSFLFHPSLFVLALFFFSEVLGCSLFHITRQSLQYLPGVTFSGVQG